MGQLGFKLTLSWPQLPEKDSTQPLQVFVYFFQCIKVSDCAAPNHFFCAQSNVDHMTLLAPSRNRNDAHCTVQTVLMVIRLQTWACDFPTENTSRFPKVSVPRTWFSERQALSVSPVDVYKEEHRSESRSETKQKGRSAKSFHQGFGVYSLFFFNFGVTSWRVEFVPLYVSDRSDMI